MNKKLLKQIILASYKNGQLDKESVAEIAGKLDRTQLKQYIKALKISEKLNNVYVETPSGKGDIEDIEEVFPGKNIRFIKNPSLIVGTKINYNDDVFEFNLKNNLDRILSRIEQDYD
jgi:hypothetical protein